MELSNLFPLVQNGKTVYIDLTGKIIIRPQQYHLGCKFVEGLAPVKVRNRWGYIDPTGKIMISPKFSRAFDFAEGLAAVKTWNLWGYINKTGQFVIPPQCQGVENFIGGLAKVTIDFTSGYIDKSGMMIAADEFDFRKNIRFFPFIPLAWLSKVGNRIFYKSGVVIFLLALIMIPWFCFWHWFDFSKKPAQ
jgi:WG containing repeat